MSQQDRQSINWINSLGAALGAVSAAVMLSTLGVAGTLLGAGLSSLCITIGGALYARSLQATKERLGKAQAVATRGVARSRESASVGTATLPRPSPRHDFAPAPKADEPLPRDDRQRVRRTLPWKRVAASTAGLFLVAMSIILAFELTTGRPVSSYTGGTRDTRTGTSVPGLLGEGTGREQPGTTEQQQPDASAQPDPTPSAQQSEQAPLPAQQTQPTPAPATPGTGPRAPSQQPARPTPPAQPQQPQQQGVTSAQ